MKNLILLIPIMFFIKTSLAQRPFGFVVDDEVYVLDETELNNLYGKAFDKMKEKGLVGEKDFRLWTETFDKWKNVVQPTSVIYSTIANRVTRIIIPRDIPHEFNGYEKDGSKANGNPNKLKNLGNRVAYLNTYLSREVIYKLTGKIIIN